jgi:hypothetical protein
MIRPKTFPAVAVLVLAAALPLGGCGDETKSGSEGQKAARPLPVWAFAAQISPVNPPASVKAGSTFTCDVKVLNLSKASWPAKSDKGDAYVVHLGSHWLNKAGAIVTFDGKRNILPGDVEPGKEILVKAGFVAPDKPGEYLLEVDLVQELVAWFGVKGSKTARVAVKVE